jgi:hypothetical protein
MASTDNTQALRIARHLTLATEYVDMAIGRDAHGRGSHDAQMVN